MILKIGNIKSLSGEPWNIFEFRSPEYLQELIFRIGSALPGLYPDFPAEVFISISGRQMRIPYLFARSSNARASLRIRRIDGIEFVASGIPDADIQSLIEIDRREFEKRHHGISFGAFVRITAGPLQGYCGKVIRRTNGTARIEIRTITKRIYLSTPAANVEQVNGEQNFWGSEP